MGNRNRSTFHMAALLVLILNAAGCVSLSNFQTADVTRSVEYGSGGVGITATSVTPTDEAVTDDIYEDETYTMVTFLWRYGFNERIDIGGKVYGVTPFVGFALDSKYQFIEGDAFDAAINAGAAITEVEIGDSDNSYVDYFGGLLFTLNMSDTASVTLAPKAIFRDINTDVTDETATLVGGTVTLEFGKEDGMRIYPEIGFYKSDEADFLHYGIGFRWW